jgi:hypothetical protein
MNEIERLTAIEEIKTVKARYFRCLDTKDWLGYQAVFAPDAVLDTREALSVRDPITGQFDRAPQTEELPNGCVAVAAYVRKSVEPFITVHHGHMPEIEILSDTQARGIWSMEDRLWLRDPTSHGEAPFNMLRGFGHYHETYEKVGGRWLIKTLKLTRLRLDRS